MARLIALALIGATTLGPLHAADLSHYTSKEGREIVVLTGELVAGDADRLVAIIKETNALGREVSGVRLNSRGGLLTEGAKLADAIRFAKIATVVPNGMTCASACFVAFAAGGEKFASYSAWVGVHGASTTDANGSSDAPAGTVAMAKVVKELGVPASIIGQMVVTPPDQIVWLSSADLQSMGVKMTGKPAQTAGTAPAVSLAPQQTQPDQMPGAASTTLKASLPPSNDEKWRAIVTDAAAQSSAQHGGTPDYRRSCQPELKICNMAILFKGKDGKDMMVRVATDANDINVSRDICSFNSFGDVRDCLKWDKGTTVREMKNAAGDWVGIDN